MRIARKLGLLVAVPLVAVLAFAALAVVTTAGQAVSAERLRQLVVAGAEAAELAYRLQGERAGAVVLLSGGRQEAREAYADRVAATSGPEQAYQRARDALSSVPAGTGVLLERIDGQLNRLGPLRDQVAAAKGAASAVAFGYRILIADLIALRESVPQGAPADVADRMRAAAAVSRAAEQVGRQQVAVLRSVEFGVLTPAAAEEITAARTGRVEALLSFDALARPSWRSALERSALGEEPLAAQRLEAQVARTSPGGRLGVDATEWTAAMDGQILRLRQVEALVDADLLEEVTALRDARRRTAGMQTAAVALAVAVAVALAVLLGRPVVSGLRRLRDAAHEVAHQRLPDAVARLERHKELGGLSPEQFAEQVPAPVQATGRDELAEVGSAFNAVHREAIRTAAGQALLRVRIGEIVVNVARRSQGLADQLTTALDDLERDELDPGRLKKLYRVDLGVTLLRRTNDSLLVLGGAAPAQVRTADQALADVLRAAQGMVRDYQRVETGLVDTGVAVRAHAVDDVVALLAELIDNACRFSPPDTVVRADARWLADRVVVQIADAGVGMDPARRDELNRRLATVPELDVEAVRSLGLAVVGRIAARHEIRIELRQGYPRGTIAEVTLPAAVVSAVPSSTRRPAGQGLGAALAAPAPAEPATSLFTRVEEPGSARVEPLSAASGHSGAEPAVKRPESRGTAPPWPPPASGADPPLQIFEEVSRWFTPRRPAVPAAGRAQVVPGGGGPAEREPRSWRTAADAGWAAAERATDPEPVGVTRGGLPKRRAGAQLVPGGVATPAPEVSPADDVRDPAAASAVAMAFARGLASGRASYRAPAGSQTTFADRGERVP